MPVQASDQPMAVTVEKTDVLVFVPTPQWRVKPTKAVAGTYRGYMTKGSLLEHLLLGHFIRNKKRLADTIARRRALKRKRRRSVQRRGQRNR